MRLGIDIGGTFTDVVLAAPDRVVTVKVPSTRPDPSVAVLNALREIFESPELSGAAIRSVSHGTTVATNAVIEREFAPVGLVTTQGFRDLLEIGDQRRPALYDLFFEKPAQLVPRDQRREALERVDATGAVVTPLDLAGALGEAAHLIDEGIQSIAICFLHSYLQPEHEEALCAAIEAELGFDAIWTSSGSSSEYREYGRFSTTVMNAALGPVMAEYLERFGERCRDVAIEPAPLIMQSNGGVMTFADAQRHPARTLLSGPAAGVLGAIETAEKAGVPSVLTFDMGGTSTDISIVEDGRPTFVQSRDFAGFPVRGATIDIATIGAGGGSVASIDGGGRLRVGPVSAGARPGPAAYGLGGNRATVTDANVVVGRLSGDTVLAGRMMLDVEAAHRVVHDEIAVPLGLSDIEAACAILEVVNSNMALAARLVSVARGLDPDDFTLLSYGGAGGLHAVDLAAELGIPEVLVPKTPGLMCAAGLLSSPVRHEVAQTVLEEAANAGLPTLNRVWNELADEAQRWWDERGFDAAVELIPEADVRYRGQHHELTLAAPPAPWDEESLRALTADFYRLHELRYGYSIPTEPVQIVNLRLVAQAAPDPATLGILHGRGGLPEPSGRTRTRSVYWEPAGGFAETEIVDRGALPEGTRMAGPVIVEQADTTIAVPSGYCATTDANHNLRIRPL
ncbi:MAG: N-methylhydantoinase [Solirubrobacteraceae bacterium]|nr:N-methylhydantoinase [Solirubrobacteraceae bacterium]